MNADPTFAAEIVKVVEQSKDPKLGAAILKVFEKYVDQKATKERDDAVIAAHTGAYVQAQKNERHVIYSYAAMWIIAAGFLMFLWRRQQALKLEISGLRKELEVAARETNPPGRT